MFISAFVCLWAPSFTVHPTKPSFPKSGSRPFFYPMHLQPVFRKAGMFEGVSHPIAERICEKGFYIPSGLAITEAEMERVAKELTRIMTELSKE